MDVGADAYIKAATALVSWTFAAFVLAAAPKRAPNRFLAYFLALVAGGLTADALRAIVADPALDLALFRVSLAFAALDPLALYYFVTVFPARSALNAPRRVALVAVPCFALALATPFAGYPDFTITTGMMIETAVVFGTTAVHGVVFALVLARLLGPGGRSEDRLVVVAVAFAALPILHRVGGRVVYLLQVSGVTWSMSLEVGVVFGLLAAAALAVLAAVLRAPAAERGARSLALVAATLALAWGAFNHGLLLAGAHRPGEAQDPTRFRDVALESWHAVRWLVFGTAMSMAVLRHDLLGMSLAERRRAARALVALAAVAVTAAALATGRLLLAGALALRPLDVVLLLVALVASQQFRSLVDRVAAHVYGVPLPGDRKGASRAYREALAQAADEARPATPAIARLRDELADKELWPSDSTWVPEAHGPDGRYRFVEALPGGGFGRTWVAHDTVLDRKVAVKQIHARLRADPTARERFLREARLAARIRHPSLVVVHDVDASDADPAIVMEYVEGGDLRALVARGPVPAERALAIAGEILAGLEAIHAAGVLHRDLKPGNVLLTADGHVRIADFGVAALADAPHVGPHPGTPAYMAPEQRAGKPIDARADVYAVGAILYEMLTARRWPGPLADVPGHVRSHVARALAERPEERFASARDMREAVAEASRLAALA